MACYVYATNELAKFEWELCKYQIDNSLSLVYPLLTIYYGIFVH